MKTMVVLAAVAFLAGCAPTAQELYAQWDAACIDRHPDGHEGYRHCVDTMQAAHAQAEAEKTRNAAILSGIGPAINPHRYGYQRQPPITGWVVPPEVGGQSRIITPMYGY